MRALCRALGITIMVGAITPTVAVAAPGWVTPPATLSPSPSGSALAAPMVATNSRGDTVAVWQTGFGSGPFFESERPAGGTFTAGSQIVLNSAGTDLNGTAPEFGSLFVDDSGTIYLFFLSGSGSGGTTQINVATKPIGGATWTVTVIQPKGLSGGFIPDPPVYGAIAPNGAAVVIWEHDNTNDFLTSIFEYSTKSAGSNTWSAPATIPGTTGGGTSVRDAINSSGEVAAVFGFVGSPNLLGASKPGGGGWTTANQMTTSPGGSSQVTNPAVAIDRSGQATAIWSMSDHNGNNPVVQFSTKSLSASSWPQAMAPGGSNDLSPNGSTAGSPTLAVGPDGTTDVAYTLGSSVIDRSRPAAGGAFTSTTLPDGLTSPFGADVATGANGATAVLWSGQGVSGPAVAGAFRPAGSSAFTGVPGAPGTSDANVVGVVDGPGDVGAVWQDQPTAGNFVFKASGLVTAPPTITGATFPSTAAPGSPFSYSASITPDQWTTATGIWAFGDGTIGALNGTKTYGAAGVFNAVLSAIDPFGNSTSRSFAITVGSVGGGGGGGGANGTGGNGTGSKPRTPHLHSSINHRTRSATFKFSDPGASGFQCALVKARKARRGHRKHPKPRYAKCRSPKRYKHLARGSYQFFVRGTNQAGTSSPAVFRFTM